MKPRSFLKLGLLPVALLGMSACLGNPGDEDKKPLGPIGPVASNAAEAWPTRPDNVPVLGRDDIAQGCAIAGACAIGKQQPCDGGTCEITRAEAVLLVDLCVGDIVRSAERAIPLTGFNQRQERAEFYVQCLLDHAGDCAAVDACATEREGVGCQEDGCSASGTYKVTCEGSIATLQQHAGTVTRDCARAYASCDPASPTGCTDRQFSRCPPEGTRADHCDGDVRLGCDGSDQVSYHDCSRLGGTCGALPNGDEGCIYAGTDAACAGPNGAGCQGQQLAACVNGARVLVDAPTLCL